MAINITTGFRPYAREPLDARSGPYETIIEAKDALKTDDRYVGLPVLIITDASKDGGGKYTEGTVNQYIFDGGIEDIHLVQVKVDLNDPSIMGTSVLPIDNGGTGLNTVEPGAVLTGNGTEGLTAETNLTFDGSILTVVGTVNATTFTGDNITSGIDPGHTHSIYAFDASSYYDPSVDDALEMPEPVGGIIAGTTAGNLAGKNMNELFDELLFPTVLASVNSNKSLGVSAVPDTGVREIGEYYFFNLTASFNGGSIKDGTGSININPLVGDVSSYDFNGPGTSNPTNQVEIDVSIAGNVVIGSNIWNITAYHKEGTGLYYDNKGNTVTNLDPDRVSGSVTTNSSSKTGVYPFFWGMTAEDLSAGGSNLYTKLTKSVTSKSSKTVTLNGTAEFIYFVYPDTYGDLTSIEDQNGYPILGNFSKISATVDSVGLSSNWTNIGYTIYKSNTNTTVNSKDFKFIF